MYQPKYNPKIYQNWVIAYLFVLKSDFFGWLEDQNLEEYCLGDDTVKFCQDHGIPSFEEWVSYEIPSFNKWVNNR